METQITVNGIEYVRKDAIKSEQMAITKGMPYVIVRCRNAGVHAGYLAERSGETLRLIKSRRLWRWCSAATLSELAVEGPLPSKMSEQRYGCELPDLTLTTSDVCEVIPCTDVAARDIQAVHKWVAQ